MDYELLLPEDIVLMRLDGTWEGRREPSSEWRIHRDVYAARPEVGGVFHAHSMFCTSLACLRRSIPGFHYMVTRAGGEDIRCADYATFGSEELSRHVLGALEGRKACLMANHGMVAVGDSLQNAYRLAVEVETLAAMYWRALQVGEPVLLEKEELARVLDKWSTYGQTAGKRG
jgi:L-fuculose-phosphate aldolase